jgi:hypothetical protein
MFVSQSGQIRLRAVDAENIFFPTRPHSARSGQIDTQMRGLGMLSFARLSNAITPLILAVPLTLLSVLIERNGPELDVYGNMCGPKHDQLCYEPVLKSGFPMAYVFDAPGTSVERDLGLEDRFSITAFLVNIVLYFVVALLFRLVTFPRRSV